VRSAAAVVAEARQALMPPPRLRLSEWADQHFYLSAESAAEPGRWTTLPYQREPMDAITDPRFEEVTFMKSARVGYTKMLNAAIGYHIEHDPCAVMLIQPTEDDAKGYSKEEIEPMLRDCP
jgi:phage terminase large subunit GpA-like protein